MSDWNVCGVLLIFNAPAPAPAPALLYRQLGISEDATYEEVNAAYDSLVLKYKGDVKAKTRLSVTRDKVFELRLKQRVDGSLKISAEGECECE